MSELQYIRTDRNGTKIFHDWTCPRCGGAGRSDNWWRTGYTCHECGGSGKRNAPKEVKEYTPEYAAKLEARRAAKQPKHSDAELKAMAEEAQRNRWKDQGLGANGNGYLYLGDTFPHKTAIRIAGGKWDSWNHVWVAPKMVEGLHGVRIIEIHAQDVCNENDYLDYEKIEELKNSI